MTTSGTVNSITIKPANDALITFRGILITGSTGGTIQFKWAQTVANGVGTTVEQYSYMKVTRVQ
jgi:hypothetical protein